MVGRVEQGCLPTAAQAPEGTQDPVVQVAERVPAKPILQTGVPLLPSAESATQSPAEESAIRGSPGQGRPVQDPVVAQVPLALQEAEKVPV